MIQASYTFPRRFLWGTATAAHQVEGNNQHNDWWDWEQQPGRILKGHRSGLACDWWGGRWREDLDRAAAAGQNAHRLSVEWSRIEPSPAVWDEAALEAYVEIVRGALARKLMPMVTLHHFTNPRWVAEQGGWANPNTVPLFERFVRKVVGRLRDLVGLWVTINEPNVYMTNAYITGLFPPGEKNLGLGIQVGGNLIRAHAAAYRAIHEIQPGALVGLAHHYRGFAPARPSAPLDRWVARALSRTFNDLFPVAAHTGRMRVLLKNESIRGAARTQDYFGLNYYTREKVAFDLRRPVDFFARRFFPADADLSPTGFVANDPDGFWEALGWARRFGLPIYVTENGVEDPEDRLRPRYLAAHLRQLWRGVNFNWPIRGYFHWTLVDNFEWERGWTQRFGLWELNPETQERRKRASADFFAEVCRTNSLASETVAMYAPDAFDQIFPTGRATAQALRRD